MSKDKVVAVNGFRTSIKELQYNVKKPSIGNYNISITETSTVESVEQDHFTIVVTRDISFVPDDISIRISLRVMFDIDKQKTAREFINDRNLMKEHLLKKTREFYLMTNAGQYLSTIVAEVTSWFGSTPLLLPPVLENNNNNS